MPLQEKPVNRVLVMIETDGGSSDVYDLTALLMQAAPSAKFGSGDLSLSVKSSKDWNNPGELTFLVSWRSYFGEFSPSCAELTDGKLYHRAIFDDTRQDQDDPSTDTARMSQLHVGKVHSGKFPPSNTAINSGDKPLQITHAMQEVKINLI